MGEEIEARTKLLHPDRRLITPLDEFRGADFVAGTIISGAVVSNGLGALSGGGRLYQVSSEVKVRMFNLEMFNAEPGWIELEFRDGNWNGGRVLGPYTLLPRSRASVPYEELKGRYFTSSVFCAVLSGYAAQPLSNGIKINASYILDPTNFRE